MNCELCGSENRANTKVCLRCGAVFQRELESPYPGEPSVFKVDFGTAITIGFRKYFDFRSRATRAEYWWFILFLTIGGFMAGLLDQFLGMGSSESSGPIQSLFQIVTLIPGISVGVRRLHDIDKTGWWSLLILTILGIILLWIWAMKRGNSGENRFGVDPRYAAFN